jgi:hypothetical protein
MNELILILEGWEATSWISPHIPAVLAFHLPPWDDLERRPSPDVK